MLWLPPTFLFVDQKLLHGSLKMMKYLTADDLGNSLIKVMNHEEIRGSFGSVRKELKELGVEKKNAGLLCYMLTYMNTSNGL